jgi:hypothetical protein
MQILPSNKGFGDILGESFSTGFGREFTKGLDLLSQHKLDEMHEDQAEKRRQRDQIRVDEQLEKAGLPHLRGLPKELQLAGYKAHISPKAGIQSLSPDQIDQQAGGLSRLLNIPVEEAKDIIGQQKHLHAPIIKGKLSGEIGSGISNKKFNPEPYIKHGFTPDEAAALEYFTPKVREELIKQKRHEIRENRKLEDLKTRQARKDIIDREKAIQTETFRNKKLEIEEAKLEKSNQKEINTDLRPYVNKLYDERDASKDGNNRLGRQKELVLKGNLKSNKLEKIPLLGKVIDVTQWDNPDSAEFRKISADYVKDAKSIFGARLTDADLDAFLKTVPTLNQSDAGKLRLINNLELLNEGKILKADLAQKIINDNKGKIPWDLRSRVDALAKPQLDEISYRFKSGALKEIPGVAKPDKAPKGFETIYGETIYKNNGKYYEPVGPAPKKESKSSIPWALRPFVENAKKGAEDFYNNSGLKSTIDYLT